MQGGSPEPCRRRHFPAQAGWPHRRARREALRDAVDGDGPTHRGLTPGTATALSAEPLLRQLKLSGAKLEEAEACRSQARAAHRRFGTPHDEEVRFAPSRPCGGRRIRALVPHDMTKVSGPPDVASASFPAKRISRRERDPASARMPGFFGGTKSSNTASSSSHCLSGEPRGCARKPRSSAGGRGREKGTCRRRTGTPSPFLAEGR